MVMNDDPETRLAMTPRYLTVAQVAGIFGCCTETVYGWVREGKIAYTRLPSGPKKPGNIRIRREVLEGFDCPAKEANQSSSTSKAGESSTSNGFRDVAADLRSRARARKVVPMPRRPRQKHS